jgi:hypothetical protein
MQKYRVSNIVNQLKAQINTSHTSGYGPRTLSARIDKKQGSGVLVTERWTDACRIKYAFATLCVDNQDNQGKGKFLMVSTYCNLSDRGGAEKPQLDHPFTTAKKCTFSHMSFSITSLHRTKCNLASSQVCCLELDPGNKIKWPRDESDSRVSC